MPNNKGQRGASGGGTIRKKTVVKKNGLEFTYWEARITVGKDPGTGRQIQRSFTGKTQKEVRQKMQAAAVQLNENEYMEPSKITLGAWLDKWLSDYMNDKKYLTVKNYRSEVNTHIKPRLGAVRLADLDKDMIQSFYNGLHKNGRTIPKRDANGHIIKKNGVTVTTQIPLAPKTIHNIHGILTEALSTAVSLGYLKSNPATKPSLPKVEKHEITPLTDQQVEDFLLVSRGDEYEMILKTILFTGLRESEAIGLTWDCVNFDAGTIKIAKQLQKRKIADGGATFASLKNEKIRILKPAPFVMSLLKQQEQIQINQSIAAGELWKAWTDIKQRNTALVFTTAIGRNIQPQTLYNHYKKLAAKIGAPDSKVHDLRHTFAVLSLQNGDDVKTVQVNLGHATAAFTLDVYGHVSQRMKDDSSDRMESYIQNLRNSDPIRETLRETDPQNDNKKP